MTRPNLDSDEGRAAYRAELRRVGWPLRWGGLALIVVAAGLVLAVKDGKFGLSEDLLLIAYGLLAMGWALVVTAIFMRTRHHKRRLAEGL